MDTKKLMIALKDIKSLALNAAKRYADEGEKYVNLSGGEKGVKGPEMPLQEGLKDKIFSIAQKIVGPSAVGTILSGVTSIAGYLQYLDAKFNQWYYSVVLQKSKEEVMNVMQNFYGAQADEGSVWGKIGLYTFFVFFVISLISIVIAKKTQPKQKRFILKKFQPKQKINKAKRMQELAGLNKIITKL